MINAFFLGIILILGMNFCIQDYSSLFDDSGQSAAYTKLWIQTVGSVGTAIFLTITLVAIECRQIYFVGLKNNDFLIRNGFYII